jgi:hypothetical protein
MRQIDFAKAAGAAVGILVLNLLCAVLAVLAYSIFVAPGHPSEYYDAAALWIAPWSAHIAGTLLFLGAGFWFARQARERNGYLFAVVFTALYGVLDSATVGFKCVFELHFVLSMLGNFGAALVGAFVGTRTAVR